MDVLTTQNTLAVPDSAFPVDADLGTLAGLIDPPISPEECPLGGLKLQGEHLGYSYPLYPFETDYFCSSFDWMSQNVLLPTPEEQETDISGSFYPPPPSYVSPCSLHTPDSSSPSTPTYYHDPEVVDALSLIDDSPQSCAVEILPQFDVQSPLTSPASYNPSPALYSSSLAGYEFPSMCDPLSSGSYLSSPLSLPPQDLSPLTDSTFSESSPQLSSPDTTATSNKPEGIRELLVKTEDSSSVDAVSITSHKRKQAAEMSTAGSSDGSGDGRSTKGKRRKLSKMVKKERKKEQNKQAALRYRRRKRGEVGGIDERREELEAVNSDLKRKVDLLTTEINYLQNLWSEIEAAKTKKLASRDCK